MNCETVGAWMIVVASAIALDAQAGEPDGAGQTDVTQLLARIAPHAQELEEMKRRGSFTLSGRIDELARNGHVDGTKELVLRSTATPTERRTDIIKYLEDGADKTAEARRKAEEHRAERAKTKERSKTTDLHLPFLASEQARYAFSIAERDTAHGRVRIAFRARTPAENAFNGSAWVDEAGGEIMTMGFSPSKTRMFVDHIDVTMRFDLVTPLGRAPSSISFDASGGLLFLHKHVHATATISDPLVAF